MSEMERNTEPDLFCGFDTENLTVMDGYTDCIVGIMERFGMEPIVCYDKAKVLARLAEGGMSHEEAIEFFEFNQIGAWVGDTTPCYLTTSPGLVSSDCSDPWHELLCELDEIREYLGHRGAPKWAATIGDVQARLTRQKETIKTLDDLSATK